MSNTRKKHKVFVYGTLRPRGVAATHNIPGYQLFNYFERFPYIQQGDGCVYGNILEITDKQLKQFDHIEGIAHGLFRREVADVYGNTSGSYEDKAFVYVGNNVAPQPIQSGDWYDRS